MAPRRPTRGGTGPRDPHAPDPRERDPDQPRLVTSSPGDGDAGDAEPFDADGPIPPPVVLPNDSDGPVPAGAFEVVERARWEDVDLVGIVRYSAYTRLLDVAEAELMRAAGLEFPNMQTLYQLWLVRRVLHLEYHAPARFDAPLRVALWIERAGTSALTLAVSVRDGAGELVHAGGRVVLVAVDARTLIKRALPADLVTRVAAVTASRASEGEPRLRSI